MPEAVETKWPVLTRHDRALEWLRIWIDLGRAPRTIDAYGRGLAEYLQVCEREGIDPLAATRAQVAVFVRELTSRPSRRGTNVVALDSGSGLANATLQQRLVPVRLFYDFLVEEGVRESNPVGRGRYTPGRASGGRASPLVPRMVKLPWIPSEAEWLRLLAVFADEPIRNRVMLALAYDAALRREELCSVRSDDLDPAHRTLRVRAETTKTRRERVVPYSASTGVLLSEYLAHRATLSRARGGLFLSESRRNRAEPVTLWTWSKVVRRVALAANLPRFSTHTTRHLCLTDLARMGWELHAIATFAGHRSTDSTLQYIHLSGRDLSAKLNSSMAHIHAWRIGMLTGPGPSWSWTGRSGMTIVTSAWPAGTDRDRPSGLSPADCRWDRRVALLDSETAALLALGPVRLRRNGAVGIPRRTALHWRALTRLTEPLDAAVAGLHHGDDVRFRRAGRQAVAIVLQHCADTGRSCWGWTPWEWARLCGGSAGEFVAAQSLPTEPTVRPFVVALAYLLGGFTDFHRLGTFNRLHLTCLIFGEPAVDEAMCCAEEVLDRWGYRISKGTRSRMRGVFSQALLLNRSPRLDDLDTAAFAALRVHPATDGHQGSMLYALQRVVAALGHCDPPVRTGYLQPAGIDGADPVWAAWIERWHATSTLTPKVRATIRTIMGKAGRWLAVEHPEITDPGQWTRATCAAWVAAVDRMSVGDWTQRRDALGGRGGQPVSPRTKAHNLMATRVFFRDCQEWEWIGRRFDPNRALALPRSIAALIGTNPRVIADEVWAKLLWAGLNLAPTDLPGNSADTFYPMELIRAVTLTWLFSGLRSDEMSRLRVGCIRWQHDGLPIPSDSHDILAEDAVCLLDVPVHKTGTAFTKPVDPIVGQTIEAWQAVRPSQPKRLDRKTSEHVDMLFSVRAQPVAKYYINHTIIPALCGKAGVPTTDIRGNITSHRARSTIASQLYNAKEPMTLFELQAWLGHRTPHSTQHYAKITPHTLSKAYSEAGYFARNVRTIEVLVDRDAVTSGAAAAGQPWQHYDLGHGWCTYSFFEQCPHRMACARCDFYTPKDSTKAQLLEASDNLQRMLASIPLTDDERAAVDDGHTAVTALLDRLADVPTPAGPTPRELGTPTTVTMLPIVQIQTGKSS